MQFNNWIKSNRIMRIGFMRNTTLNRVFLVITKRRRKKFRFVCPFFLIIIRKKNNILTLFVELDRRKQRRNKKMFMKIIESKGQNTYVLKKTSPKHGQNLRNVTQKTKNSMI